MLLSISIYIPNIALEKQNAIATAKIFNQNTLIMAYFSKI